jgi:uncharacterized membrane protein
MAFLINLGRFFMLGWVVYALLLIFAPNLIHQPPNQTSGVIQAIVAFVLGNLLDRALGALRRRDAERLLNSAPPDE